MTVSDTKTVRFDDMPLSAEVRAGLKQLGYERATPVQATAFGPAMAGRDLVVQSKTGTGKTTAFGLPLIERIRREDGLVDPQAIILCPTRELAIQVSEELSELGDPKGVRVLSIYGGTAMQPQLDGLKHGCDVVVGTPGRVLDHIRRRTLRLVHVQNAVLDEADEMLSMGFWDEVTAILDQLPTERQTFLFSATLPDQIRRAAAKYLRDPERLDISRDEITVEHITNYYYERDDSLPKPRNLLYVLECERPESAIIFTNTRDDASVLAAFLRRQGLNALALSGDFSQKDRERIMGRMKRGELQYLVATDIAARGIDISDLSHVFNYSLPEFTEVYVHRIGRTGRIGKKGTAVSLVSGRDEMTFTQLARQFSITFHKKALPERADILKLQAERVAGELLKIARDTEITAFIPLAERLQTIPTGGEVIAFLLKRYFNEVEAEREHQAREEEQRRAREEEAERRAKALERGEVEPPPAAPDVDAGARRPRRRREDEPRRREDEPRRREDEPRARGGRDRDREPAAEAPAPDAEPSAAGEGEDRGRRRRGRDRAEPRAPESVPPDRVRLFVNRGETDGYDADKMRTRIGELVEPAAPESVLKIELRRTHAFVEVAAGVADAVVARGGAGLTWDDKPLTIERARMR